MIESADSVLVWHVLPVGPARECLRQPMNCLNEAIGLALPGNGTVVVTHVNHAQQIVDNAHRYYSEGDERFLPRSIATREAF